MKALFSRYKKLHLWLLANLALLSAFLLARRSRGAMNALTEGFTNPLRRMLGRLCECVPFSVAEGLYRLPVKAESITDLREDEEIRFSTGIDRKSVV